MNTTEFFYWLQGYFELSGSLEPLTDEQIDCIIRHDRLVAETTEGARGEQMIKIGVMLQCIKEGIADRTKGTDAVRTMVAAQFQHVIDPAAGPADIQSHLTHVHGGNVTFRC